MPIVTTKNKLSQVLPPASPNLLMERLCNHWVHNILQVLAAAGDCAMSFSEIKEGMQCTSEKMFANALIELDAYGLIKKKRIPNRPKPRNIEYRLTEQGKSLLVALNQLQQWVNHNHKSIVDNTIEWNQDRKENESLGK